MDLQTLIGYGILGVIIIVVAYNVWKFFKDRKSSKSTGNIYTTTAPTSGMCAEFPFSEAPTKNPKPVWHDKNNEKEEKDTTVNAKYIPVITPAEDKTKKKIENKKEEKQEDKKKVTPKKKVPTTKKKETTKKTTTKKKK